MSERFGAFLGTEGMFFGRRFLSPFGDSILVKG